MDHGQLGVGADGLSGAVGNDPCDRICVLDQPERGEAGLRLDDRGAEPRFELRRQRFVAGVGPGAPGVLCCREVVADRAHGPGPRGITGRVDQRRDEHVRLEVLGWQQRPVGAGRRQRPERRCTRLADGGDGARPRGGRVVLLRSAQEIGRGCERNLGCVRLEHGIAQHAVQLVGELGLAAPVRPEVEGVLHRAVVDRVVVPEQGPSTVERARPRTRVGGPDDR